MITKLLSFSDESLFNNKVIEWFNAVDSAMIRFASVDKMKTW